MVPGRVSRIYRRAISIFVVINELQACFKSRNANNGQDRTKNFFAIDPHRRLDVIKKRGSNEEALRIRTKGAAIRNQGRAFFYADSDIVDDLVAMLPGNNRAHIGFRLIAGINLQFLQL